MRYLAMLSLLLVFGIRSAFAQGTQIPIVTNDKPLWAKGKEWRVADKPLVDIGKAEAEPEYELSQVRGVLRLADGIIVVANQQNELRYYDKNGKYIRTAGRKGEGPGEFIQISGLILLRDGNIGVNDYRLGIQVYSPDGKFVRLHPAPKGRRFPPSAVFDDASIVIGDLPQSRRGALAPYTDSIALSRYAGGQETRLGTFPASRFVPRPNIEGNMHFGPVLTQAGRGQTWYVGFPEQWQVTQYNSRGTPQRTIRRAWQPVEITQTERRVYREARVNMGGEPGTPVSPQILDQRKRLYVDEAFAKTLPAFGRLLVDAADNLWAQVPVLPSELPNNVRFHDTNAKAQEWSIFDPNGRWLGQVQTPGNLWVFDIGTDYVLGLWRDEFDVEHVRMYAITKPR
ncbi:MAG: 6-bladed beta-propeller [Gemmatimonadota bacterium]